MKRLIAAAILGLAVLAACAAGSTAVTVVCDRCTDALRQVEEAEANGNINQARHRAEQVNQYFEKRERLLGFFVNHGRLDNISQSLRALPDKEETDFVAAAKAVGFLIADLRDEFGFCISGFF